MSLLEQQDYQSSFDKWYSMYPKKQARAVAEKSWQKMKLDSIATTIMLKTAAFVQHYREQGKLEYLPMPATFLNQRRWEDQLEGAKPATSNQPPPTAERKRASMAHRMYNGAVSARSGETESVAENCIAFNKRMEEYGEPYRDYSY